jgi:hypothetical protein
MIAATLFAGLALLPAAATPTHCTGTKIFSHRMIKDRHNGISLGVLELYRDGGHTCAIVRRTSSRGDRYLNMGVDLVRCPRSAPDACLDTPERPYPNRQEDVGDYRHHTHPVVLPTAGYCVWAFGEIQTHSHGSHEGRGGYAVTAPTDHGRFCS